VSGRARAVLDPWRDVNGIPITVGCRVEQTGVDVELGALRSRLDQRAGCCGAAPPGWWSVRRRDHADPHPAPPGPGGGLVSPLTSVINAIHHGWTVTAKHQRLWLDKPESEHTWLV
jgi:hypothetical protein